MKKILVIFVILVSNIMFAQVELFNINENGINFEYEKKSVPSAKKSSLYLGYILNGKLAFNVSFSHYYYDISNVEVISFAPSLGYLLLRQNENMPISLILNGEYEFGYAPIFGIDYNLNSISFNSKTLHLFKISDKFKIIPSVQLLWRYSVKNFYETMLV